MPAAVHLRTLRALTRHDIETLWLLTGGWYGSSLRQRALPTRRVGLLGSLPPEQYLALEIAARAASVDVYSVPPSLAADPARTVASLAPLLDGLLVPGPGEDRLWDQTVLPVIALGERCDTVTVLGQLYRHLSASHPLRDARVGWHGSDESALATWCDAAHVLPIHLLTTAEPPVDADSRVGTISHVTGPARIDLDAGAGIDLKLQAAVLAALLEFGLHRPR